MRPTFPLGLRFAAVLLLALVGGSLAAQAQLRFAALFSDGVVLQQGCPHPVWGWATPHAEVQVEFAGQTRTATAAADGRWQVELDPLTMNSDGAVLAVTSGTERVAVAGVRVGEVWLCAGQSNMEYSVRLAPDATALLAAADLPWLRHFKVARADVAAPAADVGGAWTRSSPTTAGLYTAVGFHFARALHETWAVPVGLVNASWGSTAIADWSPGGGQYHGMIAPLAPFPFRGVLWYQGEADAGRASRYAADLAALIAGWRARFGAAALPFLLVQLPNYDLPGDDTGRKWADLRGAQAAALRVPGTGLVVTIDAGLSDEGHPPDKTVIGRRLARLALVDVLHAGVGNATGPLARRATAEDGALRVHFAQARGGLELAAGVTGDFAVAGDSGVFQAATPEIDGDTLVLRAAGVTQPRRARYAWTNDPVAALFNREGLPAAPFQLAVDETGHAAETVAHYGQTFAAATPGLTKSSYNGTAANGTNENTLPENPAGWIDGPPVTAASNRSPWSIADDAAGRHLRLSGADQFDGNGRAYATVGLTAPPTGAGDDWSCRYDLKIEALVADGATDTVFFGVAGLGDRALFGLGGANVYIGEIGFTLAGAVLPLAEVRPVLRLIKSSTTVVELATSAPLPAGFLNLTDTFRLTLAGTYDAAGRLTLTARVENLDRPTQAAAQVSSIDAAPYHGGFFGIRHRSASATADARLAELRLRHDDFTYTARRAEIASLPAPTSLDAVAGDGWIGLGWEDAGAPSDYLVERAAGAGDFAPLAWVEGGQRGYVDHAVAASVSYRYRVRAQRDGVVSAWSPEATASVTRLLAHWREEHFGFAGNAAFAANGADADGDGVVNLLEYALAGDPVRGDSAPGLQLDAAADGALTLRFRRARAELRYRVEVSSDLRTWAVLAEDPGEVGAEVAVPAGAPEPGARFLRLRVSEPE